MLTPRKRRHDTGTLERLVGEPRSRLHQISIDIQRAVKDSENVDVAIHLYQVGDSIMAIEENANVARTFRFVLTPEFRVLFK